MHPYAHDILMLCLTTSRISSMRPFIHSSIPHFQILILHRYFMIRSPSLVRSFAYRYFIQYTRSTYISCYPLLFSIPKLLCPSINQSSVCVPTNPTLFKSITSRVLKSRPLIHSFPFLSSTSIFE